MASEEVGITPRIAAAAKLHPRDEILTCSNCKVVIRRSFEAYVLRYREEVLGTYDLSQSQFRPTPWLMRAIDELDSAANG